MSILDKIIEKYKDLIHFADFSFFIHDLTKAHEKFFEDPDNHTKPKEYEKNFPNIIEFLNKNKIEKEFNLPDNIKNFKYKDKDKKFTENFLNKFSLFSVIITHHKTYKIENYILLDYILFAPFGGVDGIESDYGKGLEDRKKIFEQNRNKYLIISPLFTKKYILSKEKISEHTDNILNILKKIQFNDEAGENNFLEIKKELKKEFSKLLGETRFPLNDTTLYHHSYLTGALGKALLVKILVEAELIDDYVVPIRNSLYQQDELKDKQEYSSFKLLLINIPTDILLKNISKIPVLSGYFRRIKEIFEALSIYYEQKYPIATKVYEDKNSIGFIVPYFSEKINEQNNYLEEKIKEKFNEITKDILDADISLPVRIYSKCFVDVDVPKDKKGGCFTKYPLSEVLEERDKEKDFWTDTDIQFLLNFDNKNYIKCPSCNFYVIEKNKEFCEVCESVYESRKKDLFSGVLNNEAFIFEEVADSKNFLCAVYLRLNCDYFLNGKIFENIFKLYKKDEKGLRKNLDNHKPPSPSRLSTLLEENSIFFEDIKNSIIDNLKESKRTDYKIFEDILSEDKFEKIEGTKYKKFIEIHKDYREFLFLIPAENLFDTLQIIRKEYLEKYIHVSDKLPLYIASGIFKHKFPFPVVYQTLKKAIEIFHNKRFKCSFKIQGNNIQFFYNNKIICEYEKEDFKNFMKKNIEISWTDGFYKKFGEKAVFWEELNTIEHLEILPSFMLNLVVDSSQRRLDLTEDKIIQLGIFKEDYNSLWAIDDIKKLIDIFENNFVSKNQIYHFIELIFDKYEVFSQNKKLFEQFIEMLLSGLNLKKKIDKDSKKIIVETIFSGLFFEAVEVYKYGYKKQRK